MCVRGLGRALIRQEADFRDVMTNEETKNFVTQRKRKPQLASEVRCMDSGYLIERWVYSVID